MLKVVTGTFDWLDLLKFFIRFSLSKSISPIYYQKESFIFVKSTRFQPIVLNSLYFFLFEFFPKLLCKSSCNRGGGTNWRNGGKGCGVIYRLGGGGGREWLVNSGGGGGKMKLFYGIVNGGRAGKIWSWINFSFCGDNLVKSFKNLPLKLLLLLERFESLLTLSKPSFLLGFWLGNIISFTVNENTLNLCLSSSLFLLMSINYEIVF